MKECGRSSRSFGNPPSGDILSQARMAHPVRVQLDVLQHLLQQRGRELQFRLDRFRHRLGRLPSGWDASGQTVAGWRRVAGPVKVEEEKQRDAGERGWNTPVGHPGLPGDPGLEDSPVGYPGLEDSPGAIL